MAASGVDGYRPALNLGGPLHRLHHAHLGAAVDSPEMRPRHVGTLEPLWNLFDLTPEGRPDWYEQFSYT